MAFLLMVSACVVTIVALRRVVRKYEAMKELDNGSADDNDSVLE